MAAKKRKSRKAADRRAKECRRSLLSGLARRAGKSRKDFNARALARGTKVELEHTRGIRIARQIAMDHLTEDPNYYVKLARMEKA